MIRKSICGFFIQNGKEAIPVRIDRYPFGEWLHIYFQSLLAEKPEVSKLWMNPDIDKKEKNLLIEEATEYYFLSLLASWFNASQSDQGNCTIFTRKEILHLCSSNRFLDLFIKPMEKRPVFSTQQRKENVFTYFATNDDGNTVGLFEYFGILLPEGSSFRRQLNWLEIDTPFCNLRVLASCDRYSTFLPIDFAKYYLGFRKIAAKNTEVKIEIRRKLSSYIIARQRKLYMHMKEFLEYFEESLSYQNFLDKYDWEAICIQSKINESITIKSSAMSRADQVELPKQRRRR